MQDDTELKQIASDEIKEEYRNKSGQLIIQQAECDWKTRVWVNVYLEMIDEWVLVYLIIVSSFWQIIIRFDS